MGLAGLEHLVRDVGTVVFGVIDLEAVNARGDYAWQILAPVLPIQLVRVRPGGQAADRVDEPNAFGRFEAKALEVRRPAAANEAVERLVDRLDVAGLEQRLGDVRPTDAAFAGYFEDAFQLDRRADAVEGLDHFRGAGQPRLAEAAHGGLKVWILVLEEQPQDVDGRARQVGAQLDGGDDPHAELCANPLCFGHAVGVVVV